MKCPDCRSPRTAKEVQSILWPKSCAVLIVFLRTLIPTKIKDA